MYRKNKKLLFIKNLRQFLILIGLKELFLYVEENIGLASNFYSAFPVIN